MDFIISQILGFIALILVCIGYFFKSKKKFLIIQIVANIFYASAFLVQGAVVGGLITLVSTIRCFYLLICEIKNFKKTIYFLPIFIVVYVVLSVIYYATIADLIPAITATMFTIAFYIKDLQATRYVCILPNLLLIFYNIICLTYTSALLDFIEVVVLIVAIFKFYKERKSEKVEVLDEDKMLKSEKVENFEKS